MAKNFYIETNEEITSIIDRVKNVPDADMVLIIPKKAAILQSLVNLKILKRQLDRLKKEVVIITSDKLGKNLAARADFIVKQKLDRVVVDDSDISSGEELNEDEKLNTGKLTDREILKLAENAQSEKKENIIVPVIGESKIEAKKSGPVKLKVSDIIKKGTEDVFTKAIQTNLSPTLQFKEEEEIPVSQDIETQELPRLFPVKEVGSEKPILAKSSQTFQERVRKFHEETDRAEKVVILPNFGKKIFAAIFAVTLVVVGVVLFLVLPTATVIIEPKTELVTQEMDLVIDKASSGVIKEELKIPGELVEVSKDITKEFPATGKKQVKERAIGTITVYNEWDSQSQTLVENTRFLSTDGILFRSTKSVVVPGFKRLAGQDIPGSITVSIIADEAGEESNIKATRFSIPGLKGTVKYEKIYGVSTEAMSGGKVEEVSVVSESDFNKAKKAIEQGLREELVNEIKTKSNNQTIIAENAIVVDKADFTSSKKAGEEAKNFSLTLKLKGTALAFVEQNALDIVKENIKVPFSRYTLIDEPKLNYGKVDFDAKQGRMSIKVYTETMVMSKLEGSMIIENVKGKNIDELKGYFANMSEIENADVRFWPSWVKSVPRIDSKVNIDIK